MIQSVLVTNSQNEELLLELMRPDLAGMAVVNIDGLGPAKSNINVRENALSSGSVFNSAKTPSRNIVFTLSFQYSDTIEEARLRTYQYFPSESRIRLDVTTDAGTYYIYGYVESNEPTIFSPLEGTVISIICPDPFFRSEEGVVTGTILETEQLFEFPFENDNNPTPGNFLEFGDTYGTSGDFTIELEGSINVGPTLTIFAIGGAVDDPLINFYNANDPTNVDTLSFTFTTELPQLEDGDHLEIVCEPGNKSVRRWKASTEEYINYLGTVDIDSAWPVLAPGENEFSYEADTGGQYMRFTYEYTPQFVGV